VGPGASGNATWAPDKGESTVKTSQLLIASAVAAALALPMATEAGPAPKPKFEAEKCYGVAKAGKNDCQTANSSCAGTSKRDQQGDAWIYMPAGACEKLVGGSTMPKKA
jgi:uncharacterized membrane protein